jgi:hypothetical protein
VERVLDWPLREALLVFLRREQRRAERRWMAERIEWAIGATVATEDSDYPDPPERPRILG